MAESNISTATLRVGVSLIPPIVAKLGNDFGGFEIVLWGRVAQDIGVTSTFT